jgi:hypothetical protein
MPSLITLMVGSTRNESGNCTPILDTVRLCRILQLSFFDCFPITLASTRSADAGIQDTMPSLITLISRSTRNQSGNWTPILVTAFLYPILQLAVFDCCSFTLAPIHCVDAGIRQDSTNVMLLR